MHLCKEIVNLYWPCLLTPTSSGNRTTKQLLTQVSVAGFPPPTTLLQAMVQSPIILKADGRLVFKSISKSPMKYFPVAIETTAFVQ